MKLTRRALLGAIAAVPLIPAISIAAPIRDPYVVKGETVDSIIWHIWEDPRNPGPSGPVFVDEILPWDGKGYPIVLKRYSGANEHELFTGFYDHEWSNLLRDVPDLFWHRPENAHYPNVHSYVREQRFGEPPAVMEAYMERNRLAPANSRNADDMRAALVPHLEQRGLKVIAQDQLHALVPTLGRYSRAPFG